MTWREGTEANANNKSDKVSKIKIENIMKWKLSLRKTDKEHDIRRRLKGVETKKVKINAYTQKQTKTP